jgi:hypothetical protein
VLLEELFGVHGSHATGTRGGNGLAVAVVLHVSGYEHSGNAREATVV